MNATSTPSLPYDANRLRELAHLLIDTISEFAQAGWTPATSSNFSHRLDEHHVAITVSGRDKRYLTEEDIMAVDLDGNAVGHPHTPRQRRCYIPNCTGAFLRLTAYCIPTR